MPGVAGEYAHLPFWCLGSGERGAGWFEGGVSGRVGGLVGGLDSNLRVRV
jgi:hypothetical protein